MKSVSGNYQYLDEAPLLGEERIESKETVTKASSAGYARLIEDKKDTFEFSEILHDSRLWSVLDNIEGKITLGHGNPKFLFGVSTCTYQDSGMVNCPDSQWVDREKQCLLPQNQSGESANLFKHYQTPEGRREVTDRLHKLGVNSYRFSIEWSHIEPEEGKFNPEMLKVYVDMCKHLRDEGIQPMITLHHFSEPKWFHAKGSFENEGNIKYFVDFAKRVFPELSQDYQGKPLVENYCTINEPAIEAFSRYIRGAFSPALNMEFTRAALFLKGAIKAHMLAYDTLKEMNPKVKIGIVHQMLEFKPVNFLISPITKYLTYVVNEVAMNCFKTGNFCIKVPGMPWSNNLIEEKNLHPKTDFVGLQFYARPLIGFSGSTSKHEEMTNMPFREDPEGLYHAIIEAHRAFKAPVIVTENGISTTNDEQRSRYMTRALYSAQEAQKVIGEDNLKGYFIWSLCDNFEWDMGMDPQKFGVYKVSNSNGKFILEKDPKKGIYSFIQAMKRWRETLPNPSRVLDTATSSVEERK